LWGRPTDVSWAVIFPRAGDGLARHPSQLYEAFLEGVVMFTILWFYTAKPKPRAAASGLFLILYGCFRSFVEFFREPDEHIGFIAWGWLTKGQLLSFPMIAIGLVMMIWAYKRNLMPSAEGKAVKG
jgi:phosphatidylglycerol:prolipoprotein diacylglycerol transferase